MKKTISVVLVFFAALTLCLFNVSAEKTQEVEHVIFCPELTAHIVNKSGARLYFLADHRFDGDEYDENDLYFTPNTDDVMPFKKEITVTGEYTVDSVKYYEYYIGENSDIQLYSKPEDISFDSPVKPTETDKSENSLKFENPKKFYAVNPEGAYLYSGPNALYDKVSEKILPGTEITCDYYSGFDDGIGECEVWAYTSYKGAYGWAYVSVQPQNHPDFVRDSNDPDSEYSKAKSLYFVKDTPIFRDIYSAAEYYFSKEYFGTDQPNLLKNNKIGTVPKNTQINFDYYCHWEGDLTVRINYNGTEGWVNVGRPHEGFYSGTSIAPGLTSHYIITPLDKWSETYSEPDDMSKKTETKIPPYYVLKCDYYYASEEDWGDEPDYIYYAKMWYRVNYLGEELWITSDEESIKMIFSMSDYKVIDPDIFVIYSRPDESSEKAGEVVAGDTVYLSDLSEDWNLIQFNGNQFGWVKKLSNEERANGIEWIGNENYDEYNYELPDNLVNKSNPYYEEMSSTEKRFPFDMIIIICAAVIMLIFVQAAIAIRKTKK